MEFGRLNRPDSIDDPIVEMTDGYRDGADLDGPALPTSGKSSFEPGPNRGEAYRHGFANGRDDRRGAPRASTAWIRAEADRILGAVLIRTHMMEIRTHGFGCAAWPTPSGQTGMNGHAFD